METSLFVIDVNGTKHDVSKFITTFHSNKKEGNNILDRTPICIKQDGSYFWWEDIGVFKDLDSESVDSLILNILSEKP